MSSEQMVALGDVAELVRGVSYRPTELCDAAAGGVPLLRATNIGVAVLELSDVLFVPQRLVKAQQHLRKFDVVIAMSSGSRQAVGRLAPLRREWTGCVGAFCGVIRPIPSAIEPEYLGYVLQAPLFRERIETFAVGTAIMNLSRERLLGFKFKRPSPPEQRAIASVLGALDDKIDLNRRMCQTLEEMARALFRSWFVDFDPVRAKMEGRDPGLPKEIADLFPSRLVDSELGPIPEGWRVAATAEIADVIYGAPFASSRFNTKQIGVPLVRIRDLTTQAPDVWTDEEHPKGYRLSAGDIVVGMDGEFRAHLWAGPAAWLNQRVCVFRPRDGYCRVFVRNAVTAPLAFIEATETATTVIHLGKSDIDRFRFVVAPRTTHQDFSRIVTPWYERFVASKQESATLAALRDTLLPKLISGELRVPASLGSMQEVAT